MDESQPEEVLLDENAEAARFDFYMVGGLEPSPNHKLLAYAEDTSGNEKYTLHVKDIGSDREMLKEPIKVTLSSASSCLFCDCCNAVYWSCVRLKVCLDIILALYWYSAQSSFCA